MGRPTTDQPDIGRGRVAGSFTGTGNSDAMQVRGGVNITLSGTFVATVQPQRSFDGGTTWHSLATLDGFAVRSFTAPISLPLWEPEEGVLYRLACTAYSSGTVVYRLSC